jgi:hypothetical protein
MKTFAFGTLEADTDTWLLASNDVIALDINLLENFDSSLEHKKVSVIGTMGIPPSFPDIKLIVEKLASHTDIAIRAYNIFRAGTGGSSNDHWFRAERELLGL